MGDIGRDVTSILMAIIGVAILYVLVSKNNQTTKVVQAGAVGFSQALSTAMGMNQNGQFNYPSGF